MNNKTDLDYEDIASNIKKLRLFHLTMASINFGLIVVIDLISFFSLSTFFTILIVSGLLYALHLFYYTKRNLYYQYFSFSMILLGLYYFLWSLGLCFIFLEGFIRPFFLVVLSSFIIIDGIILIYAIIRSSIYTEIDQGISLASKASSWRFIMFVLSRKNAKRLFINHINHKEFEKKTGIKPPSEPKHADKVVIFIVILIIFFMLFIPNAYSSVMYLGRIKG